MIPDKLLVVHGIVGAGTIVAATIGDASTLSIAIIGVGGALTTALVGAYSAYRAARHQADLRDAPTVQVQLSAVLTERDDLRQQVTQWKDLYEALKDDSAPRSSSPQTPTPMAGATNPQQGKAAP
jgi:hypothetical protein